MSPDEKICPVCDSKLSKDERKCLICGTDLAMIDEKHLEDVDLSMLKDKTKAIDDILSLLKEEEKKVLEKVKKKEVEEKKPELKPQEQKKEEKVVEKKEEIEEKTKEAKKEVFSCPVCYAEIPIDANSCPKCGAIFEEAVIIICPVCKTEVPVESNSCPKCGAIFVSEEEVTTPKITEEKTKEEIEAAPEKSQEISKPQKFEEEKAVMEEKKPEKKVEKKPEDMAKELALKVSEAKVLLETIRKFGAEEKGIKDNISQALSFGKDKNYEKALEIMDSALLTGRKLVLEKISALASDLEVEVSGYSKMGCDVRKGLGLCERALFAVESENFENAVKLYTQASDFAKKLKETFELRKKEFDKLNRSIDEYGAYGVPGINELKNILEKAMLAYSRGEIAEGDKYLNQVKEKLADALPNFVSSKIAEQASKLREEKLLGLDVREKIEYLKEANICIKKKDFAQALVWVNKLEKKEA